MSLLTLAALRKQIAAGTTGPLYVLGGVDEAEKSAVAAEFAGMVDEGLEAFNVDRLYGADTRADTLIDAANLLPMMAPRRIVIVFEAEKLLAPKREASEAEQKRLEAFLNDAPPHATVVFVCSAMERRRVISAKVVDASNLEKLVCGAMDKRRRVVKVLLERAHVIDCGTVDDAASAEMWVKARAAKAGITIDAATVRALVQRTGFDIRRLRAGLERVSLYTLGQPRVTVEDVREAISAAPDAPADWGVANAIRRRDASGALRELTAALEAGASPFMVLGQLRIAVEKLPVPRIAGGVEALFRTDLALKSSGGEPRMLLERLLVELCGSRRS